MQSQKQKHAALIWQGLPHLLIWAGFFLFALTLGFSAPFRALAPALPLMIALIWSWEWRSPTIALSLCLSGLCMDLLSGLPIGWHTALWVIIYWILPRCVHQLSEDEPFVYRWFICAMCLVGYLLLEVLFIAIYGLMPPTLGTAILRWLVMVLCLPALSRLVWRLKSATYQKLWMHLPDEMRIGTG